MKIIEKLSAKVADLNGCPPVTIAFLGDSVTQGCFDVYMTGEESLETYFDSNEAYHTKVRQILNMLFPKAPVNIINGGISGGSAHEGAARLERDILRFSPDLCVVCFGLNDSCVSDVDTYIAALGDIFDRLQEQGVEVVFMTPNMMCTEVSCHIEKPFLRQVAENISHSQIDGTLEKFLSAAKELAKSKNIPVCDCYAKWKTMADQGVDTTALLSNHINHPIPKMNWMFAYSLVETFFTK